MEKVIKHKIVSINKKRDERLVRIVGRMRRLVKDLEITDITIIARLKGGENYVCSSTLPCSEVLWDLEQMKNDLVS